MELCASARSATESDSSAFFSLFSVFLFSVHSSCRSSFRNSVCYVFVVDSIRFKPKIESEFLNYSAPHKQTVQPRTRGTTRL